MANVYQQSTGHRKPRTSTSVQGKQFESKPSARQLRRFSQAIEQEGNLAATLTTVYVGISAVFSETQEVVVAIAIHDGIYLVDYSVQTIELGDKFLEGQDLIADYVVNALETYEHSNLCKIIGAGIPCDLVEKATRLCPRMWLELDIVPISIPTEFERLNIDQSRNSNWIIKSVEEQADSMARKCVIHFGPTLAPVLQVGYRGMVEVDAGFKARLVAIEDLKHSCRPQTWKAMLNFVTSLKQNGTKIAFFSSTPQGGGVALMRHALVRLAKVLGVDMNWYVPKPKPGVFRITKTVHNILQGVSGPAEWIGDEDKKTMSNWIEDNANRYWLCRGGPLRPPEEGGADVIIIDDPQMPGLLPLIKKITPTRPVLYRSHIQIRSDLIQRDGTPQADVWKFLWQNIQLADMFISHPIPVFVPSNVHKSKVAYMPATTDWLDGLNKTLNKWDQRYYEDLYNLHCYSSKMAGLGGPGKKYIIQIARFDPAKGIPDVIESYAEFRHLLSKHNPNIEAPQLVICGNGSIDDPDGTMIYDQTLTHIETHFPQFLPSISVMRLPPNDQLLNALVSASHIVLQLSTREGFEVKVSEALQKGKPVIATNCGGIPLQVQHSKNGFLVEPGDWHAVAAHLLNLWTDEKLYGQMSDFARKSVSDEVGTMGNALAWFYLADTWANGEGVVPNERWVNDLARDVAGLPYMKGENRLPRF